MPTLTRGEFSTYFEESGAGEPVVLICGLGAEVQAWRFQVPELSKHFRVITFDNRGAGRSSVPERPYSIPEMAEDLVALLDHLNVPAANILGWSMGGMIAQSLAVSYPARVRRLALLGTTVAPDAYAVEPIAALESMRRSTMPYEHTVRYMARMAFSPNLVNNAQAFEGLIQFTLNNPYRQSLPGFFRQVEAVRTYRPPDITKIRVPTTVLVGEQDQLTPVYLSKQLAESIPGARLRILPGAHSSFVEYPAQYNEAFLEAFMSGAVANDA